MPVRRRREMTDPMHDEREVSRRKFLALGGAIAAAGHARRAGRPVGGARRDQVAEGPARRARRRAREGEPVHAGRAVPPLERGAGRDRPAEPEGAARDRQRRRTRATSMTCATTCARAGVKQLHFESVPMQRWTTAEWSLDRSPARAGPVRTASYIPYSGQTPAAGVTGPLAYVEPGIDARARLARRQDRGLRRAADDRAAELLHGARPTRAARTTRAASSPRRAVQAALPQRRDPAAGGARGRRRGRRGRRPRLPARRRRRLLLPLRRRSSAASPASTSTAPPAPR